MKSKHAKSPCCRGEIIRFGKRRRQCVICRKTWRIRLKKRGRKRIRAASALAVKFINDELPTLRNLEKKRSHSREYFRRRINRSLAVLLSNSSTLETSLEGTGPLILIADAMWHRIRGAEWTIYVMLVKSISGKQAIIFPPAVIAGHESAPGWAEAIQTMDQDVLKRLIALVSDGVPTLLAQALKSGWLIQRCHFHLLSAFQNYATTGPRSKNKEFAFILMKYVKEIISTTDQSRLEELQQYFENLLTTLKSRGLRRVINGLLRDLAQFRTYLAYPDLNLPTTSNAAESVIQMIRDLLYRARGFNNPESLKNWVKALFITKPIIQCNGHKPTK